MWNTPWKGKESFTIVFGLTCIGFILQWVSPNINPELPAYPINIFCIATITILIVILPFILPKKATLWLSSVHAALAGIFIYFLLVLIIGLVPQTPQSYVIDRLGISNMVKTWPFILMSLYILLTLGFAIRKRIWPLNLKNLAFFLNHAGLWIIIAAGVFGRGDLKSYTMDVQETKSNWLAYDRYNIEHSMPFAIKLIDFAIDDYHPEVKLVNTYSNTILNTNENLISKGSSYNIENWKIEILEYLPYAIGMDSTFYANNSYGATQAALVSITDKNTNTSIKGWLSNGNSYYPQIPIQLNDSIGVLLTHSKPKKFHSSIKIYQKDAEEIITDTLWVNKPLRVAGWDIYQYSYDQQKGRWSTLSTFNLVKDPWLPVIYAGIFMLLLGAALLFFTGKKSNHA